ncbi:MAG: hypothetical protein LOY03_11910 [Cyclobacteriaceae bacterium]|jgi:hypothetical protein|nr:hypothetical protein [Cyclobacteriaceae bacterium]
MDAKEVDQALGRLAAKRQELSAIDYSNPRYDELEEELHDMEDEFQEKYGAYLENILQQVHNSHCPENDVLLPIAYMGDGVPVDIEKGPNRDARLILQTNPLRILLQTGKDKQEVVWTA